MMFRGTPGMAGLVGRKGGATGDSLLPKTYEASYFYINAPKFAPPLDTVLEILYVA